MPTEPLAGAELLAKVAELRGIVSESDVALACGYVNASGRGNALALRAAIVDATGYGLKPAKSNRPGRGLSFVVKAGTKGQVTLSGGYAALIGIEPGDKAEIKQIGNSLIIHPAGVVPVFRDEPVPAPVVTYDSMPLQAM